MKWLVTISLLLIGGFTQAQDIHFSQFNNSPLNVNPAMTGSFKGNLRGVLNHRSQWSSVDRPFATSALSIDTRLFSTLLGGDAVGVGVHAMNDVSGPADLSFSRVMAAVSYLKRIGEEKRHTLSVGVHAGFFQRSIDESKLMFESQFDDVDFNVDRASGEALNDFNIMKTDFQIGFGYRYKDEDVEVFGGLASFHITEPNESILEELDELSRRYVFHGGSRINITDEFAAGPSMLVVGQNRAREITFGGDGYYTLPSESVHKITLNIGTHYRFADAVIFRAGAAYKKWQAAVSYDINISTLAPASNYKGGFELSLIYIDRWLTSENTLPVIVPCPRL